WVCPHLAPPVGAWLMVRRLTRRVCPRGTHRPLSTGLHTLGNVRVILLDANSLRGKGTGADVLDGTCPGSQHFDHATESLCDSRWANFI
ncbi:MAG TPA: hypothetical protein VGC82_07290, partial [Rhodopila sp.]